MTTCTPTLSAEVSPSTKYGGNKTMTLVRKNITFARTTDAVFFEADGHAGPDASDLDSYMFDRETRMDEAWGSGAVGRMGSDRIQPPTATGQRQNHHRIAELLREIGQHKLMLIAVALMLIAVAMVKQWFSLGFEIQRTRQVTEQLHWLPMTKFGTE